MANVVVDYGWGSCSEPESCGYITPKIMKLLKTHNVQRVYDLGSGNGALAGILKRAGYFIVGVEYSVDGVRVVREVHPDINFYNFGVEDDPALVRTAEGVLDAVVSTEVVEHPFSPHLLPMYARGLLDMGGLLILTTPYHGYIKNLALALMDKWDDHHTALWHGGHIKLWSRKTLTKLLEANGFRVESCHGVGRIPYLWRSMVIAARAV